MTSTIFFAESIYADSLQETFILFKGIGNTEIETTQIEKTLDNQYNFSHINEEDLFESEIETIHQKYTYQLFNLFEGSKRIHKKKKDSTGLKSLIKTNKYKKAITIFEKIQIIELKLNLLSLNDYIGQNTEQNTIEGIGEKFSNIKIG